MSNSEFMKSLTIEDMHLIDDHIFKLETEAKTLREMLTLAVKLNGEDIGKRLEYWQDLSKVRSKLFIATEALEKVVDKYFDLPVEMRMEKRIKEGKDSLIAREALEKLKAPLTGEKYV